MAAALQAGGGWLSETCCTWAASRVYRMGLLNGAPASSCCVRLALVLCAPPSPLPHVGFLKGNFLLLLERVSASG